MKENKESKKTTSMKALSIVGSSRNNGEREVDDFYPTPSYAVEELLKREVFSGNIWECACGDGSLSKVFENAGYKVKSTDLVDRGFGENGIDFLNSETEWNGDIITNPPYKFGKEFVEKAMELIPEGKKVAMFLKLQFMEGKARKNLFLKYPPKVIYVSSSRLLCTKNAEFDKMIEGGGSAVAYGWYVWEKGYKGKTEIQWFN